MPDLDIEYECAARGARYVAGVDEVGRGCWAGPLTVAAVVVDMTRAGLVVPGGVDDSKRLTSTRRESLRETIVDWALAWAVVDVPAARIDALGMGGALREGFRTAVARLSTTPDAVLIDGPVDYLAGGPVDYASVRTVVRGDQHSATIAAASILAKVHRDKLLTQLDAEMPGWGLAGHKGYPTAGHREAVSRIGLSPEHRRSWQVTGLPGSDRGTGSPGS